MKSEFHYEALTKNGEIVNAIFIGSLQEFELLFKDRTLILLNFKELKRKLKKGKFSAEDFKNLIEELSYLLSAKIPIDLSIKQILFSVSKESQEIFLETFLSKIRAGTAVSIALKEAAQKVDYSIDNLSIQIIASGEEIGELGSAFDKLKERLIFTQKLVSDIKSALTYPTFLFSLSLLMIFFVFFFIVPKFSALFSPAEFEKLPALSKAILTSGQFLTQNTEAVSLFIVVVVLLIAFFIKTLKNNFTNFLFRLPFASNLVVTIQLSYIFNSLGIMLTGGIELDRAIRQSSKLASINELKLLFENTLSEIKKGNRLSHIFATSPYIPASAVSMVAVGESTARLGEVCLLLGERFSDSFQKSVKRFLLFLEPAIIIFMGVIISVVVISIMLAVLSVSDIIG